jgi:hypothetical protein
MLEFARRPSGDLQDVFRRVGEQRTLGAHIIEKDFWVCWLLRLIFTDAEFGGHLVFKGGTSLSKVFGVIQRFSEDIDLSVDPDWLGFGDAARLNAALGRHTVGQRAVADLDLLARVRTHKQTCFRSGWAHYESAVPGSLHLVPIAERRVQIERDYLGMADMFMATPPSFATIMAQLQAMERQINGV